MALRIGSSGSPSIGSVNTPATDDLPDSGQALIDDVLKLVSQINQQATSPSASPDTGGNLLQQLNEGIAALQANVSSGTLAPDVQAQAQQLLQGFAQAVGQAAQGGGYSKQDTFQSADGAVHHKHKHHHAHASPKPVDDDSLKSQ